MILDRLSHASTYGGLAPRIQRALQHLATTDWSAVGPGRYELEASNLVAIVSDYETQPEPQVPWEAHRQYIDVQYVHTGVERIGYAHLSSLDVGTYDEARDLLPATGTGGFVRLPAGSFAILWPHDAHRPGIADGASERVRKVVVKVAVDERQGSGV